MLKKSTNKNKLTLGLSIFDQPSFFRVYILYMKVKSRDPWLLNKSTSLPTKPPPIFKILIFHFQTHIEPKNVSLIKNRRKKKLFVLITPLLPQLTFTTLGQMRSVIFYEHSFLCRKIWQRWYSLTLSASLPNPQSSEANRNCLFQSELRMKDCGSFPQQSLSLTPGLQGLNCTNRT